MNLYFKFYISYFLAFLFRIKNLQKYYDWIIKISDTTVAVVEHLKKFPCNFAIVETAALVE